MDTEDFKAARTDIALCVGFTFYHSTMSARVGEAVWLKESDIEPLRSTRSFVECQAGVVEQWLKSFC